MIPPCRLWSACFLGIAISLCVPNGAHSEEAFYEGRTVTILQSRPPGGLGDNRNRALASVLGRHIPGRPTVVMQYMPGAGGRKAANYLYRNVRPDGLTIGNFSGTFVLHAILGAPGISYDYTKFIYLGSGYHQLSNIFHTRKALGLDSLEKLRAAPGIKIGSREVGHSTYIISRFFGWLLDLKDPKFVTGYSAPELVAALVRGEVDARQSVMDEVAVRNPEWLEQDMMNWHAVFEVPRNYRVRHPTYDAVPSLDKLVETEREVNVLKMFRLLRLIGAPYVLPPGTSKEVGEILNQAFRKTFKDPDFLTAWKSLTGGNASPLLPEAQLEAIMEIPRDATTVETFKNLAGPGPLPPRVQ